MLRFFDAFSGIGGFSEGIHRAIPDSVCVGYSDIDKHCISVYERHFKDVKAYGDITKINPDDIGDFDMFCGGFPCQSFSIAGKRQGFQDIRGTLFAEIVRIAKAKRPRLLFLENVKGLLNHDGGETFATILHSFHELGYSLEWEVLNSKNFGVPQNRERVFIIGHLGKGSGSAVFPIGNGATTNEQYNKRTKPTAIYFDDSIPKAKTRRGRVMDISGALMATFRGGIAYCLDANYWKGQRNPDKCMRTLISDGIVYRRFTPVECERLQGYQDNWTVFGKDGERISDSQRYKMLGNSITVNVIEEITRKINNQEKIQAL
jgi:DNA (cytosine-5)-methyltransferase 1